MVITILEAHVEPEKWPALQAAYQTGTEKLLPGMISAYLVRNSADPSLWRMMAVWNSREAADQIRASGETLPGVLMFRAAGAEPVMSLFEVVAERSMQP
jgi:quinol monooxygenase YgiN